MEKFCPISDSNNLDADHGQIAPQQEETMCSDAEIYFKLYEQRERLTQQLFDTPLRIYWKPCAAR